MRPPDHSICECAMESEILEIDTCRRGLVMRDVASHANQLRMTLLSPDGVISEDTVWLSLVAGLERVSINLQKHDPSIYMCGSAFEFYAAHSYCSSQLMLEVTRFLYCWAALEAFVGELPGRKPKVPEIRKRLTRAEAVHGRPVHFDCVADHLRSCLIKRSSAFKDYEDELEADYGISVASVFHFVSRIRNGLAHGLLKEPRAAQWGGRPADDLAFVTCCQRVVLFTIQMLAVEQLSDGKVSRHLFDGDDLVEVKDLWNVVHLKLDDSLRLY